MWCSKEDRIIFNYRQQQTFKTRSTHIAHISNNNIISSIHVAAHQGHVEVIQLIHQSRTVSCALVSESRGNFLHVVVRQERTNVVKYVIEESELKNLLSKKQDYNEDISLQELRNA